MRRSRPSASRAPREREVEAGRVDEYDEIRSARLEFSHHSSPAADDSMQVGNQLEDAPDRQLALVYDDFDPRLFELRATHAPQPGSEDEFAL